MFAPAQKAGSLLGLPGQFSARTPEIKWSIFAARQHPGDLLVSVLNLNEWDQNIRIMCSHNERPGVIRNALKTISEWNIALAESITLEAGKTHCVDIICERKQFNGKPISKKELNTLRRLLKRDGFRDVKVQTFPSLNAEIAWSGPGEIRNGWVHFPRSHAQKTWKDVIRAQLMDLNNYDKFDTNRLVMSADTARRHFRGVIPKAEAVIVRVSHSDKPGNLLQIVEALRGRAQVNILSALLKRGGAPANHAILEAVCEPSSEEQSARSDIAKEIEVALNQLPPKLQATPKLISHLKPEGVIYSHHPEEVVARAPNSLRPQVLSKLSNVHGGRTPVFLSRRFLPEDLSERYAEAVRSALQESNCQAIEAIVDPGSDKLTYQEVSAAMWASQMGVVFVMEPKEQHNFAFGLNLAHEFGFIQGQGKPLLLIIEDSPKAIQELRTWSNLVGIQYSVFSREKALAKGDSKSLDQIVKKFVSKYRINTQ